MAALAMVATLPGRTHGLGLFTEPILHSLSLDRESYGVANLCASLLGALFCLPCGWLLDRVGTRAVLVFVTAALGATVLAMTQIADMGVRLPLVATDVTLGLFVALLLTRGFGQSALSVASLALVGRSVGRRTGLAMGVYAFLTTVGFIAAFTVLREVIRARPDEWRLPWAGIGVAVLIAAAIMALLVRNRELDGDASAANDSALGGHTLLQALASPAFWAFAAATSFYGLVVAGTSLFNESILAERGFDKEIFLNVTVVGVPVGLIANLLGGWAATRVPLRRLLAAALVLLAAALAWFPVIRSEEAVYAYAAALAAAGGVIMVCFFSVWRRAFGVAHLGRIQGAAQLLTVIFSALGQVLFPTVKTRLGEYSLMFPALAAVAAALAIFTWFVPMPAGAAATEPRVAEGPA